MSPLPPPSPGRRAAARAGARPGRSRLLALLGVGLVAFGSGAVIGAARVDRAEEAVESFGQAWEAGDHERMYALLDSRSRARVTLDEFAAAHREAALTSTTATLRAGDAEHGGDGAYELPVTAHTRIFGVLEQTLRLEVSQRDGEPALRWEPHMAFPLLAPGEELSRTTVMPPRAAIRARDGTPLADGDERLTELGRAAAEVTGSVAPAPPEQAERLRARGLPADALVGASGLELAFEGRLAGRPGGRLMAGSRVLARSEPVPGSDVRTTIDPELQIAAVEALAGRYGGAVALDPRSGEVLALAGIGASGLQPPGSVFKIVTLAAALEHGVVERSDTFPVVTGTELEGVRIENADGEACGGTLRNAFAHSCNSVFAPLGAKLGAERLVQAAERFGFNQPATVPGAQTSSIPPADEIGDDLAVGATAIGQGRLLATTVQVASLAATIAADGVRHPPTLEHERRLRPARAVRARVARTVAAYMREVVESGTGTAAAIPGTRVAGKTGTAELRSTVDDDPPAGDGDDPGVDDPTDTDAWFTAFAPAGDARVAVAILLVGHGAGGTTAAPAARVVLRAGVERGA